MGELPTPLGWSPATATSEVSRCLDSPGNWQGKGGESCDDYVSQRLCTLESGYGPGWVRMDDDLEDLTFEDYATEGISAVEACCGCGGGSTDRKLDDTLGPKQISAATSDWTFEMETLSD